MTYHKADSIAPKRRLEKEAVDLAMESRWEEAAEKNRSILTSYANDVDAYNRLGRALMELGNYAQAREAYKRALELDQHNSIARKNLSRLAGLGDGVARGGAGRVAPQIFVGEVGKVGMVNLQGLAPQEVLARLAPGDEIVLKVRGQMLVGETAAGEYVGEVEPAHGPRLAKLVLGGNRYTAAVSGLGPGEVKVVIKEAYQHPSQEGRPSFPARGAEGYRAYVREGLLRPEEEREEGEREAVWEGEGEGEEEETEVLPHGFSFVGGATAEEEE